MIPRSAIRVVLLAAVGLWSMQVLDAAGARIGVLGPGTLGGSAATLAGLREGLREHGYVEGKGLTIEYRFANGRFERLPDLARELIGLKVDVLVTLVTQATLAAKDNTTTIPVVMIGVGDPIASGIVSSLSHPGGNVTGTSGMFSEAAGKRLELLSEAIPGLRRVGVLWNPTNRVFQAQQLQETEVAARALGVDLHLFEASDAGSIAAAFARMSKEQVSALNVLPDPTFTAHANQIATLAQAARLPSVSGNEAYAEAGGLMAYGPSLPERARSAGGYVARVLKGAKPGDLPIEQPTKFELVVNMKAARRLGLTVPPTLKLRADRLIE
jgi:putative ABC transport system substrate-binding protein